MFDGPVVASVRDLVAYRPAALPILLSSPVRIDPALSLPRLGTALVKRRQFPEKNSGHRYALHVAHRTGRSVGAEFGLGS